MSMNKRLETLMFPGDKDTCPTLMWPKHNEFGVKTHLAREYGGPGP